MTNDQRREPADAAFAWSASQRRALIVVLAVLCVVFAARLACNPVYVSDPQPALPERFNELADRIDPNTADWQTLAALPTIGEKRAKAVVAYRERLRERQPDAVAFHGPEDLIAVKGFGRATVNALRPHLIFPGAAQREAPLPE